MPRIKDGLYALYLRRSRADAEKEQMGQFETLAKHEEELAAFAKQRGYVLDEPYYRELVSGEKIAERKEFKRLMEKVAQGAYRGILVHDISRLGRGNAMEYGWVVFTLTAHRVLIITPNRVYDPNNEEDARFLNMEMFISNMELGNIRQRLVSGMLASAKRGCFIRPTPPFGYDRYRRPDGQWTLVENEQEAPIVRLIFDRAIQLRPLGSTARHLNDAGIATRNGKRWTTSRIRTIITNPVYKGLIRYGYYRRVEVPLADGFGTKKKWATNDDYILVDGLHEGIVGEETWSLANESIGASAPVKSKYTMQNPLSGLLVCKKCGHAMKRYKNKVRTNGNVIEHYRHAPFVDCHARGARMGIVVEALCEALESVACDLEVVIEGGAWGNTEEERSVVEKKMIQEEGRLDKLMELYFNEAITLDEFKERRAKSEQVAAQLQKRLDELGAPRKTPKEIKTSVHKAIEMLKDESVSAEAKNTFLKSFIERIEYENHTERQSQQDIRLNIVLK